MTDSSAVTQNSNSTASINTVTYNRPVSALEDPANYNIRHPLQSKWTLWYRASTKPTSTAVKNAAKSWNYLGSIFSAEIAFNKALDEVSKNTT